MRDRLILIAATFTLICSVPATAQTPDGLTPAVEQDCNVLIGATPGLYGLCVAFCEAHDAGFLWPSGDPAELDVPDQMILENYNTKKTASDPAMPCLEPVGSPVICPCWSADELLTVFPPETNIDVNMLHACRNISGLALLENVENGLTNTRKFVSPAIQLSTGSNSDATHCEAVKVVEFDDTDHDGWPSAPFTFIEMDEWQSCKDLLVARALARTTFSDAWDCFDQ